MTSLESLRIAKPCPASWDGMVGDDEVRHCGQCNRKVYNLSGMTREEAEALVSNTEAGMCVRFIRKDGMVMTRDCGEPIQTARNSGFAGLALAAIPLVAGCGPPLKNGWLAMRSHRKPRNLWNRRWNQSLIATSPVLSRRDLQQFNNRGHRQESQSPLALVPLVICDM